MKNRAATLVLAALLAACGGSGGTGVTGSTGAGGGTTASGSSGQTSSASSGTGGGSSSASSASSSASGTGGSGPSATKACNDLAMARCNRLADCSGGALVTQRYGDMTTCVSRMELGCKDSLEATDTTATPAFEETCAASVAGTSCADDIDGNTAPACQPPPGPRAAGAGCGFGAQCATGFCDVPKAAACGACAVRPADGAPCTGTSDCNFNQVCSPAGTCTTYIGENGACAPNTQCQTGLACVGGGMSSTGACKAQATMLGQVCDPIRKNSGDCDRSDGLYCDAASLTCKAIVYGQGGQPCGTVNGAIVLCAAGGMCVLGSATAGTCSATAADGAPCDATAGPPCLTPARCVGGTCILTDGTTCM